MALMTKSVVVGGTGTYALLLHTLGTDLYFRWTFHWVR